jgi:hypothetical protein
VRLLRELLFKSVWLRPGLTDLLLFSLLGWLFVAGQGWTALLADGDTGWHIRAGEWILRAQSVPHHDIFSFSRTGAPWYAWEWLADVIFALLHRSWGLAGVVFFCGCLLAAAVLIVFQHMLWRGTHVLVALPVVLVCAGASSVHYLARPHVFTLLLLGLSLWMIERDRRRPGGAVWWLVPISALWVNLHGGFFALPACLGLLAASGGSWVSARRYGALAAATLAASAMNPYGLGLHRHILDYLSSDWIRGAVDEFQSPRFRGENLFQYEMLLVASLLQAGRWLTQRRWADAALIVAWAHLSLASVRHVPVFATLAAPLVASAVSDWWRRRVGGAPLRSVARILWEAGEDLRGAFRGPGAWSAVAAVVALLLTPAAKWPRDFPKAKFPVALARRGAEHLAGTRVFTSDQWGDYLIYRFWPGHRVFIDGRSDFYGPAVGRDYLRLLEGRPGWESLFRKYEFGTALLPASSPLAALLDRDPAWQRLDSDAVGILYCRREIGPLARANAPAEDRR